MIPPMVDKMFDIYAEDPKKSKFKTFKRGNSGVIVIKHENQFLID
jgi:hypothetical protein